MSAVRRHGGALVRRTEDDRAIDRAIEGARETRFEAWRAEIR
jgi:hypothetical protein